jgi:hypothetical protein
MFPVTAKAAPIVVAGICAAAVPLLASAPANASLVAPCATGTVAVDSCTIEYNSVIYQVSKTATASTFSNQFPAPSATSPGFWWGSDLAEKDAANLAGSALGQPNNNNFGLVGPFFAYSAPFESGCQLVSSCYTVGRPVVFSSCGPSRDVDDRVWATATAISSPSSVPGPLPVLGAAPAFGFSRKLRKRIKTSTNAVSIPTGA